MKKHLLVLAAMALTVPSFSVAALEGAGTAEDPYQISTVDDLKAIATVDQTNYSYYKLMNDIDMTGVAWTAPFSQTKFGKIHFDGNCHVIDNLTTTAGYGSLFGNLDGSVKNLGLTNVQSGQPGVASWDPYGALIAYAGNEEPATITGCFAQGSVDGYYAGGLIAGTKVGVNISNCYTDVKATSINGYAGGICACVNWIKGGGEDIINIDHSFVVGDVNGANGAGAIIGCNQLTNHEEGSQEIANLSNVVILSQSITSAKDCVGVIAYLAPATPLIVNEENVLVSEETKVGGVLVENAKSYENLETEICSWPAFMFNNNTYFPCLRWEVEGSASVNDIVVDNATDTPAVYYNLQGVQVANPENGIYIVRRGNKVTKQLVK